MATAGRRARHRRWTRRLGAPGLGLALLALVAPSTAATAAGSSPAVTGQTYSVSGTITLDGGPVPYAHLELFTYDATTDVVKDVGIVHTANGAYSIPNVPDGTYKLYAAQESPQTGEKTSPEFYNNQQDFLKADDIVVLDGDVTLDDIDLTAPPTVSGVVHDATGAPAPGVEVRFYTSDDDYDWVDETTTSSTGSFSVPVGLGTYRIELSDYQGRFATEWYADKAVFASATPVVVQDDVDLGTLTVSAGGGISGRVTAAGAKPLRRITVSAIDADGSVVGTATTSKAGAYVLDHLTPGAYRLSFDDTYGGYTSEFYDDQPTLATATPVTVTDGVTTVAKDAVLAAETTAVPPGTDLEGTVRDENGEPVPGVRVYALSAFGSAYNQPTDTAVTDQFGHYYLDGLDSGVGSTSTTSFKLYYEDTALYDDDCYDEGDDEGDYCDGEDCDEFGDCEASHPGDDFALIPRWSGDQPTYARASVVTVTPGTPTTSDITLHEYSGVSGTVTSEAGRIGYGFVEAYDVDGVRVGSSDIGDDGTYDLHTLVPGAYRLRFSGYSAYGDSRLVPLWWRSGNNFTTATPLTLTSGVDTPGVSGVLLQRLVANTAPKLTGTPLVGQTLHVSTGVWNANAGADYTYRWLRDSPHGPVTVGSGPTYKVAATDVGRSLTAEVTSRIDDLTGTATTVPTAAVHYPTSSSASAVFHARTAKQASRIVVTVRVSSVPGATPAGQALVLEAGHRVGSGTLVGGRLVVTLLDPARGRHTFAISYPGGPRFAPSRASVRVVVPR